MSKEQDLHPDLADALEKFNDGFEREYQRLLREPTVSEMRKRRKGREAYEQFYRQDPSSNDIAGVFASTAPGSN